VATPRSKEDGGERKGTSAGKFTSGEAQMEAELCLAVAGHDQGRQTRLVGGISGAEGSTMGKLWRAWKMAAHGLGGGAQTRRVRRGGRWARAAASKGVGAAVSRRGVTWARPPRCVCARLARASS
jgi:hypothetical protein